jgi:hypothetical protein
MTTAMTEKKAGLSVLRGLSSQKDEGLAVEELKRQISQPDMSAVVFFCCSRYNLKRLAAELHGAFAGIPLIGCTTAGEIGPYGYLENSLVGFSLASKQLEVLSYAIEELQQFDASRIESIGESVSACLSRSRQEDINAKAFALFLVDGLSTMEEQVVAPLHRCMGGIPLIGGSAGDDQCFNSTFVYWNGEFITDAATVSVFLTTLPFETFRIQHFVPGSKKLVITRADPARRIVFEIDGKPAAWEYARILGLEIDELKPMVFSKYPVMLRIGGEYYVRSIQKVNEDGSLTFFCAIDEGLVLTLCEGVDLVSNLEKSLSSVAEKVPNPQVIIGCECILRRLEVLEKSLTPEVDPLLERHNVIGFHTYGEQFNLIHVNQTFTGVVIGRP